MTMPPMLLISSSGEVLPVSCMNHLFMYPDRGASRRLHAMAPKKGGNM